MPRYLIARPTVFVEWSIVDADDPADAILAASEGHWAEGPDTYGLAHAEEWNCDDTGIAHAHGITFDNEFGDAMLTESFAALNSITPAILAVPTPEQKA